MQILRVELESTRRRMLNDTRIASSKEMRRLYELDPEVVQDFGDIKYMTCPAFWKYRQPVTLESFKLAVQENVIMNQERSFQRLSFFLQQVIYMINFSAGFSSRFISIFQIFYSMETYKEDIWDVDGNLSLIDVNHPAQFCISVCELHVIFISNI